MNESRAPKKSATSKAPAAGAAVLPAKGDVDLEAANAVKSAPAAECVDSAKLAMSQGRLDDAVVSLRQAIEFTGDDPKTHYTLATVLRLQKKLDEAERSYRRAIELAPDYTDAYLDLGVTLCSSDLDSAIECYRKAFETNPGCAGAYNNLGNALKYRGDAEESIQYYLKAIEINPNYSDAHYNLASAYRQLERIADEAACYEMVIKINPNDAYAHYALGLTRHRQSRFEEALAAYQKSLELDPNNPQTCNDLGVALHMLGRDPEAMPYFEKALQLQPNYSQAYLNMGVSAQTLDETIRCYRRSLEINPDYPEAHNNLGVALSAKGRHDEAIAAFRKALEGKPFYPDAYFNLAISQQAQGKLEDSIANYRKAIELQPNYPKAYLNLGLAMQSCMSIANEGLKSHETLECYRKAVQLDPTFAEPYNNMGLVYHTQGKLDEAISCFARAIELKADYAEPCDNMGNTLRELDKLDEGIESHKLALEIRARKIADSESRKFVLELGEKLLRLKKVPVLYNDAAEIEQVRREFSICLEEASLLVATREGRGFSHEEFLILKEVLFTITNFYLGYQQFNDKDLQVAYARVAAEILKQEIEPFRQPLPAAKPGAKLRIGIASELLKFHNGCFWAYDWFSKLPKEHYEFFAYSLNGRTDEFTEKFRELGTYRWLPFRSDNYLQALQTIKDDNLEVLLIPDVGMTAPSKIISLVRLAPIQCVGWGHPITTGSPTVDFYLGSDLMETEESDSHYSEKLVRLPNAGLYFHPVVEPDEELTRKDFDLPEGRILYGSVQSLFKYIPQYDWIYAAIARKVPDALFVFVASGSEQLTAKFERRIRASFDEVGLDFEKFVKIIPRMDLGKFIKFLKVLDVNLDSIGWSGGVTTMRSIALELPVVTLPGQFMRGRHSYAMLKMTDLDELIADSIDGYVGLAAKLGADKDYRQATIEKIKANKSKLFFDEQCTSYLDEFLKAEVLKARQRSASEPQIKAYPLNHASGPLDFFYRVGSSDEAVIHQIFINQDYSLARLKINEQIQALLEKRTQQGLRPLILDIGANIGASAVSFLSNYPTAHVVAVEPDDANFELARRNTERLDCTSIKGAIASEKGFASNLDPGLGSFGIRSLIDPEGTIETFTIPELMETYGGESFFPFIAKIDIEGAEAELFSKNTDWIDAFPVLIIELHDWLIPGENTALPFLKCIAARKRDFVHIGENVFSIKTPVE